MESRAHISLAFGRPYTDADQSSQRRPIQPYLSSFVDFLDRPSQLVSRFLLVDYTTSAGSNDLRCESSGRFTDKDEASCAFACLRESRHDLDVLQIFSGQGKQNDVGSRGSTEDFKHFFLLPASPTTSYSGQLSSSFWRAARSQTTFFHQQNAETGRSSDMVMTYLSTQKDVIVNIEETIQFRQNGADPPILKWPGGLDQSILTGPLRITQFWA